jgi:hypothetical protein
MKLITVAEMLIEKIKKDYNGDVSLVHVHGSYIYNDTHDLSDLDIFFLPRTQHGFNLGVTFILDGIGWDFWALPWERLEKIAGHDERITSIITEGEILYYYSEEDLERFNLLKEKALDTSNRKQFLNKANEKMNEVYKCFFDLQKVETISEARKYAIGIIYIMSYVLAQINGITIKRGRKYLKQEILAMSLIPKDFEMDYDSIFTDTNVNDIKRSLYNLILNTSTLLNGQLQKMDFNVSFNELLPGWYEEMIQSYNKIYHACAIGDIYTPLFASVEYSTELEKLYKKAGKLYDLPDMAGAYDPKNLSEIAKTAREHQKKFVQMLEQNRVPIREFKNIDELSVYLNTL